MRLSSSLSKQIGDAVHVKSQRKTECLVKRGALCRGDDIACIKGEYVHLEACTNSPISTVSFVGVFIMIATSKEELVVVGVFETYAPLDFLHLFFEAIGSVVE